MCATEIERELEEFVGAFHLARLEHLGHPQIELGEIIEGDGARRCGGYGCGGYGCGGLHCGFSCGFPCGFCRCDRRFDQFGDELRVQALGQRLVRGERRAEQRCGDLVPSRQRRLQEGRGLAGHLRQYRGEVKHQYPEQVHPLGGDCEHLRGLGGVLGERPGLVGIHILVGAVCERHDLAHGLRVVELLVECGDARRRGRELPIQRRIR